MFHFPYALIVGPFPFLLVSSVAVGEGEGTLTIAWGLNTLISKNARCLSFSQNPLCLDVNTCFIFRVGCAVM